MPTYQGSCHCVPVVEVEGHRLLSPKLRIGGLDAPLDLVANQNHPFWIRVNVPRAVLGGNASGQKPTVDELSVGTVTFRKTTDRMSI